jgi:hypothetical protein
VFRREITESNRTDRFPSTKERIMTNLKLRILAGIWVVAAMAAVTALSIGAELIASKHVSPQLGTLDEGEVSSDMGEPNHGYVGELGSFEASTKDDAEAMIVVHNYPDTSKFALGSTQLDYVGAKRIGNVDGWVFKTQWNGELYPEKIFFSSSEVYFGGGVSAYIAADYRQATGWVWKMLPLRRTELFQNQN